MNIKLFSDLSDNASNLLQEKKKRHREWYDLLQKSIRAVPKLFYYHLFQTFSVKHSSLPLLLYTNMPR